MDRCLDVKLDEYLIDGCIDESIDGSTKRQIDVQTERWIDGYIDSLVDIQMGEQKCKKINE